MSLEMTPPAARLGSEQHQGSYVDWASVFAGAVTAAALSGLLLTFGSGVGLSLVSPVGPERNPSITTLVAITAAWTILVYVGSYIAGGYLAGRMRRPWNDAGENETMFRDGVHGLLVWGVGVIVSALVVSTAAGNAISLAGSALRSVGSQATDYAVDALLRPNAAARAQPSQDNRAELRAEVGRLLVAIGSGRSSGSSAEGGSLVLGDQGAQGSTAVTSDRAYLAQLIASRTGLSQQDAQQRVDNVISRSAAATEQARRAGIIAAFLTAASLLVSAVASWYAATTGGEHREKGTMWRGLLRRQRPTP